ncbi:MAG: hypothetical protein ACFHVJ_02080 [Aestuariibacter sp.]
MSQARVCLFLLCCLSWLSDAKPFHVFGGTTPELQYMVAGKAAGPATRVVEKLLQEAGIEYEIHISNWARAQKLFEEQPQSFMFAVVRTDERESQFHWLAKVGVIDLHIGRKRSRTELNPVHLDDLKGYSIGVVRNAYTHKFLVEQGFKEGSDYFLVATPSELMRLIKRDKIDYVFYEHTITPELAKAFGLEANYLVPTRISFEHRYELYLVAGQELPTEIANLIQQTHLRLQQQSVIYQQLLNSVLPKSRRHQQGH